MAHECTQTPVGPPMSAVRSCIVEAAYPFALGSSFNEPDETRQ
jgi:hypothetical protein